MSMKSLSELEIYAGAKFGLGYPVEEYVRLSDPQDSPLGALRYLMKTCRMSFVMASYGVNAALADDLLRLMRDRTVYVSLTLDNRFVADDALVGAFLPLQEDPSNSVAYGDPGTTTTGVVDGLDTFDLAEGTIVVTRQPFVAARMRNKLDLLHGTGHSYRV